VPELIAQEPLIKENTCIKHKLKVHKRTSFTQNFKSQCIRMRKLELKTQSGRAVGHHEAKFVKIAPELIAKET